MLAATGSGAVTSSVADAAMLEGSDFATNGAAGDEEASQNGGHAVATERPSPVDQMDQSEECNDAMSLSGSPLKRPRVEAAGPASAASPPPVSVGVVATKSTADAGAAASNGGLTMGNGTTASIVASGATVTIGATDSDATAAEAAEAAGAAVAAGAEDSSSGEEESSDEEDRPRGETLVQRLERKLRPLKEVLEHHLDPARGAGAAMAQPPNLAAYICQNYTKLSGNRKTFDETSLDQVFSMYNIAYGPEQPISEVVTNNPGEFLYAVRTLMSQYPIDAVDEKAQKAHMMSWMKAVERAFEYRETGIHFAPPLQEK